MRVPMILDCGETPRVEYVKDNQEKKILTSEQVQHSKSVSSCSWHTHTGMKGKYTK